jgi:hypothetical protein|mmetsp:Transcript_23767/g.28544  ORF Transcript_23767/g.28544 Transcript_23767/m.28544 type:complete len:237 (+) Transcript_23767:62-772(+)|eukprot:CAMPEP_0195246688 /NCGR_PEP_ID=MMETSP0706-20130129/535_1 /TAXON_ID=33640 /ORGANISM="Asterionellopsis glacialis, Strain CCMP134" /LENGTH=236 /DNA_ID=CAMNT_0040298079 /DNA_START=53 /DNA_END=763 /DNA_ORIENTATION=-
MTRSSLVLGILALVSIPADNAVHGLLRTGSKTNRTHDDVTSAIKNNHVKNKTLSLCERLRPEELPEECHCFEHEPDQSVLNAVIECDKTFRNAYFNDTIGMKIDIDPCNSEGSRVTLDITEHEHNIDYTIAGLKAGEETNIPIPGLSFVVPTVGHVGVDAAVYIAGNPDSLLLKIGLNACAVLGTGHNLCASSIPGVNRILPWWVLKGTYSFLDICSNSTSTATSPLLKKAISTTE